MCIWSPVCDSDEHYIIDPTNKQRYTQDQAEKATKKVRSRLVMRAVSQGNFVLTLEECDEILKERNGEE